MKKTASLTVFAVLLLASMLFAQNNPPRINGIIWKPDGISLTYVEGNGSINGFFIGRFEITQAQWQAVMGNNPSGRKEDNLPVCRVSWDDVKEFLKKLNEQTGRNYRLPTEAEREYAAKGGNISEGYKYAGSNNIDEVAWYRYNVNNPVDCVNPVGTKKPNELGIFDMSGSLSEWCEDCGNEKCSTRVIRGGDFVSHASSCRVESRNHYKYNGRYLSIGFRVVLPY